MKRPIILCTRTSVNSYLLVNRAYVNAIENSGGTLIMLANNMESEELDNLLSFVDGVLLPGGSDVDPNLYGQDKKEYTGDSDNYRDIMESELIEKALAKKLPILAICRGLQILNVKLGGSLHQDVMKEMRGSINHDRHSEPTRYFLAHKVSLKEGCLLKKIIDKDEIEVNSLHHQGINILGNGLVVSATAPDGLVEGVEMPDYPFLLGVQWHPEELATNPIWKGVFDAFIKACTK